MLLLEPSAASEKKRLAAGGGGGGGGEDQNVFTIIDVNNLDSGYTWGSNNITSDQTSDTLSLIAGQGIDIESDGSISVFGDLA